MLDSVHCREEAVFDVFPVLGGLSKDSDNRQRHCCSLDAETPDHSGDLEVLRILFPFRNRVDHLTGNSRQNSLDDALRGIRQESSADSAAPQSIANVSNRAKTSNAAHTGSMDEREIWLKNSNSCAVIVGSHSRLPLRIRSFSASVVIRRRSAAKHAAKPRRTNSRAAAAADTSAVNHGVHRSSVPDADSRPQFHSSRGETVPFTARTVSRRGRPAPAAAAGGALAAAAGAGAVRHSRLRIG